MIMYQVGGLIPVTYAVPTKTYNLLQFKCIIRAVGPRMGDGYEKDKMEKTIINELLVADHKKWHSINVSAISSGIFGV